MRQLTILFSVFFLSTGVLAAQDIGFDLLALPQTQAERLKPIPRPVPQSETVLETAIANPDAQEKPIGAILLKTGYMIIGEATLEKNVYNVFGAKGKPKIPAYKVEYAGTDRSDIYRYKRTLPSAASYDGIYALAKWCVVNAMYEEAIAEFQNCKSYISYPQMLKTLDKEIVAVEQIMINVQKRENAANVVVESIQDGLNENASEEHFDYKSWGLVVAPTVLEKFKKEVQPQLLRRCGATDCHGSNSKQEFRLTAPLQKYSTAEATLRNLKATFDQIDFQEPSASPLFVYPQRNHGGAKPIYTRQTKNQLTPIYNWAQLIPNTMPDFVDKYIEQKVQKNKPIRTSDENAVITQAALTTQTKPLNYAPIEQISHEQAAPATTNFSFFGQNRPVEQKVELVPNENGFRSNPNRQAIQMEKAAPQVPASTAPTTMVLPNVNLRQSRMPTQTQAKDPFDPTLFNRKYHE